MYTEDYEKKMLELVNDVNTYTCVKRDRTNGVQSKNNNIVKRMKDLKYIDERTKRNLTVYNAVCPRIYGQPKAHKSTLPLRPVIPNTTAPTYKLSKYIADILQSSIKSEYNITSSFTFCQEINELTLPDNYIIISLDVVSLFTNVPRELVTYSIIYEWGAIQNNTNINLDLFLEIVEFCMCESYFRYKGKFYYQIYGTAMGNPLSPILSDISLESVVTKAVEALPFPVPIVRKYVDDLFLAVPADRVDDVLAEFNKHETRLQFTLECEQGNKLPFLDMVVHRNADQTLSTDWYAKPIASGRMLHYNSFHQMKHKVNVANNFIHRVISLSTHSSMNEQKQIIHNNLLNNGYPKTLINRLIQQYQSSNGENNLEQLASTPQRSSYSNT